jgi:hypothetical protein
MISNPQMGEIPHKEERGPWVWHWHGILRRPTTDQPGHSALDFFRCLLLELAPCVLA